MKVIGIVALVIVGLAVTAIAAVLIVSSLLSRATTYCPWRHELSDLAHCAVLDETDDKVLIQHAELDCNVYYLEVIDNGTSCYYDLPESVGQLAPDGYTARLLAGNDEEILFNDTEYRLVPLQHAPSW